MDARTILRHIDEGANHFLRTLADAPHMSLTDGGGFTIIQPQQRQEGVSFVCDLRMDGLSPAEWTDLINRAKEVGFPVWFPLLSTDEQFSCFFGQGRTHNTALSADDEVYMAMQPGEMIDVPLRYTVRCGYADAVCRQAVQDERGRGATLVTVRAMNLAASRLYERLGFRAYNHAL